MVTTFVLMCLLHLWVVFAVFFYYICGKVRIDGGITFVALFNFICGAYSMCGIFYFMCGVYYICGIFTTFGVNCYICDCNTGVPIVFTISADSGPVQSSV